MMGKGHNPEKKLVSIHRVQPNEKEVLDDCNY
jgi:hypothetical protein